MSVVRAGQRGGGGWEQEFQWEQKDVYRGRVGKNPVEKEKK